MTILNLVCDRLKQHFPRDVMTNFVIHSVSVPGLGCVMRYPMIEATRATIIKRRIRRSVALISICLLIATLLPRETLADTTSLTELVGADVGISVEINGLKSQLNDLPNAEWFRRLTQLPFVKTWQQGPEYTRFQVGKSGLEALVNLPLDRFAAELFGESVLLVIVPNPNGKPDAMLLSKAERDDSWDRVLRLWDQLEAHEVQTMSAYGRSFQRRRKKLDGQKSGPDIFTTRVGRTLAMSESETQIRSVLARAESNTTVKTSTNLANSSPYKSAIVALAESCSIRVVVNPRIWDVEFQKSPPADAWVSEVWKKLEWLATGIDLHDGVVFHAVVHHETSGLPDIWQQVVKASQTKSNLAERLPANSLLAGEIRLSTKLLNWIRTLDQSERSQRDWQTFAKGAYGLLGRDLFEEVLPYFHSNLGAAVVPNLTLNEQTAPVDAILAWEFAASQDDAAVTERPTLRESLDSGLSALLNFSAMSHNSRNPESPAVIRRTLGERSVTRWLDGLRPYRPAFGVFEHQLLLATNPQLISAFASQPSAKSLATEPLFVATRSRYFADQPQWLFMNARVARQFVKENHEPLSRQLAYWRKIEATSAGKHLDRLTEILTPFDVAFSSINLSSNEVRWTTGLITQEK
ncbi:MAG: hypothetical protein NT013_15960 [Planctomycetia bacterium]|nr:hypothetical protein [Planctomycetia bacterium]